MQLILASGSPRRRELLTGAGFTFEIDVPDMDETILPGESPVAATTRLAIEKAEAVAARRLASKAERKLASAAERKLASEADHQLSCSSEVILAADTTVVVGERILGKPVDVRDAVEMLLSLSGRNHFVWTAWAVLPVNGSLGAPECGACRSVVRMREISRREAEAYAASGEPMDKAGSYAAQGDGRRFIGAIVGPLDNVIGLPMTPVVRALARCGISPPGAISVSS